MLNKKSKLDIISKKQLIEEANEMLSILIAIINLDNENRDLLFAPLMPFLAFVLDGIFKLFPEMIIILEEYFNVNVELLKKDISKGRVGFKLLNDKKKSKKERIIDEIIKTNNDSLITDYNKFQDLFVNLFGQEDYAVFYYDNVDFTNNIQNYIYLKFKSVNLASKEISGLKEVSQEFTSALSLFIKMVEYNSRKLCKPKFKIKAKASSFNNKDFFFFDKTRKNIFNDSLDIKNQALLHSNFCQLNFIKILFFDILNYKEDLYVRFKIISFLEAVKLLRKIKSQTLYASEINEVIKNGMYKTLSSSNVRNNVLHYEIRGYSPDIFSNKSTIKSIVEFETNEPFEFFMKKFLKEYKTTQNLIKKILYA